MMALSPQRLSASVPPLQIMTVTGRINAAELGRTLSHEHILVDFIGADQTGYHRWNRTEVADKVLPYLTDLKNAGYQSLFECTPAYLGRDPRLLRSLADTTGLNIITNTGFYGARENQHLPPVAFELPADRLASLWISEWENGIEDTGIKPGFIKIGVDRGNLSEIHKKLVRAAAITHLATGLTIAGHTGTAVGAFEEFELLEAEGVGLEAFIWVHAQAEDDLSKYLEAARRGAWVSLDGVSEKNITQYITKLSHLKEHNLLHKVLISHDAGWYRPGEENGGKFKPYTAIEQHLLPALAEAGFAQADIDQLLYKNPAEAYALRVRKV
jgi:phosphotriesterase-related protein